MKRLCTLVFAVLVSAAALADAHLPKVDAEVRRVDTSANKVTLRHGEIPNLNMPPMTMVFQAQDPAMLEGLNTGDNVWVTVERLNGAYTILSVEPRD
jgi:Cu(I)/Ag(I) efflux system periplasmic protein CusF